MNGLINRKGGVQMSDNYYDSNTTTLRESQKPIKNVYYVWIVFSEVIDFGAPIVYGVYARREDAERDAEVLSFTNKLAGIERHEVAR